MALSDQLSKLSARTKELERRAAAAHEKARLKTIRSAGFQVVGPG
jgi:hypothetical protein